MSQGMHQKHPMLGIPSCCEAEQQIMLDSKLASCFHETRNARLGVETVLQKAADAAKGGILVYTGNDQGAIHCLNNMRGNVETFAEVKAMYQLAAKHDVHLEFVGVQGTWRS